MICLTQDFELVQSQVNNVASDSGNYLHFGFHFVTYHSSTEQEYFNVMYNKICDTCY